MKIETYTAFKDELEKIAAVVSMPSHYEVTLDEDGKATGLSDTVQMLAHLPGGLKTVRTQADEDLEKLAWHSAAEVAGLGILARPTVQKMQGKHVSDRSEHAHELAGLGVLAAPAAHTIYKGGKAAYKEGLSKGVGSAAKAAWHAIKHASVEKDGSAGVNTFMNETFKKGGHAAAEAARKAKILALTSRPVAGLKKVSMVNGALSLFAKEANLDVQDWGSGHMGAKSLSKADILARARARPKGLSGMISQAAHSNQVTKALAGAAGKIR